MKMESVSHSDERSLLAPQRQQIMTILQVTVFRVTIFFILFISVTPSHLVMSPEVQICIKSCDAHEQQLNNATRWHQGVAYLCLESLFFSLSPLSLHAFICVA